MANVREMTPANQPSHLSGAQLETWLSRPRLARYVQHCGTDQILLLDLYTWNSRLAAAAFTDTCHLEIALRNAYDRELTARYPRWAVDPTNQLFTRTQGVAPARTKQSELNRGSLRALTDARRGLGANPAHGQVVAATSFGFWAKLTERDRTPLFWNPMLHRAFVAGTSRADVHDRVSRINKFRNRLAHNEPVFSSRTGLHDRLRDVQELFAMIDPTIGNYVRTTSTVDSTIAACPISGLV